ADIQFVNATLKTMTLKMSGNVGIGTTSPATLFEVGGSTANSSMLRLKLPAFLYRYCLVINPTTACTIK
ncbi:MAG: hypothetical protein V4490_07235, partial [Pseudomonadota bacterium]